MTGLNFDSIKPDGILFNILQPLHMKSHNPCGTDEAFNCSQLQTGLFNCVLIGYNITVIVANTVSVVLTDHRLYNNEQ